MVDSGFQSGRSEHARRAYSQQLLEAGVLLVTVPGLILFTAIFAVFAPEQLLARYSPGRAILLSVACTWWVLAWLATWKLCARDPVHPDHEVVTWRRVGRILTTCYLLTPYIWGLMPRYNAPIAIFLPIALFLTFCKLIGELICFIYLAEIAREMNKRSLAIQSIVCGVLILLSVLFNLLSPSLNGDPSSLAFILQLPPLVLPSIFSEWEAPFNLGLIMWVIAIGWQFARAVMRSDTYSVPRPTSVPLVSS